MRWADLWLHCAVLKFTYLLVLMMHLNFEVHLQQMCPRCIQQRMLRHMASCSYLCGQHCFMERLRYEARSYRIPCFVGNRDVELLLLLHIM